MCGRFNLAGLSWAEVHALLSEGRVPAGWAEGRDVQAVPRSYNVAPTQDVPLVRFVHRHGGAGGGDLLPGFARWGLVPRWFRKPLKEWKATTINARVETVADAPSFRDAYRSGRCLIPMAGYYEWSTRTATKQPYYVKPAGNEPGFFALGLWSEAALPDFKGQTVAILTEEAEGQIAAIHDGQPVIVDAEGAKRWLDGAAIETIPRQPPEKRTMHRVGKAVNSWKPQGPDLIEPEKAED